jgi:hypothetical protein
MTEIERQAFLFETSDTLPSRAATHKQSVSLKLALNWIEPAWSDEVTETLVNPEVERNPGEFIASLDRLVELIQEDLRRTPVVIIDDSDRWLRLAGPERDALLDAFFADTCRMLAERNWGIVMAVHPEYCATSAFRLATSNGYLNVQLSVPRVDHASAIRELFDTRIRQLGANAEEERLLQAGLDPDSFPTVREASADDVFEEGFETILLQHYQASDSNLRAVLTVAQQALQETLSLDEPLVTNAAVSDATLALAR